MIWTVAKLIEETLRSPFAGEDSQTRARKALKWVVPRMEALPDAVSHTADDGHMGAVVPHRAARRRDPNDTLLDVARSMQRRVPLTKLIEMDEHSRPYMAALLVSALAPIGEKLIVPRSLAVQAVEDEEFQTYLRDMSVRTYDRYGAKAAKATLPGLGPPLSLDSSALTSQVA